MNINARITTYTCLFIIVIGFLFLGFSSVANIKSTKLDKKTYYLANVIEKTDFLIVSSAELYKILEKSSVINSDTIITITDSEGTIEEVYQEDIYYEKIEKLLKQFQSFQRFLMKFEKQKFADNYADSLEKYNTTIEKLIDICESCLSELEETHENKPIVENYQIYLNELGYKASTINKNLCKARDSLKKNKKI